MPDNDQYRIYNGIWYGARLPDDPDGLHWRWPRDHPDPRTAAVTELLEDWFWAIEQGRDKLRLPDPHYQRPADKPQWTEDDVNRIVLAIEEEYLQELGTPGGTVGWAATAGCTAGPGIDRLAFPQRLALVQQLEATMLRIPAAPPTPLAPQYWGGF